MGLSFYDEKSMKESIVESLHFAFNQPNMVTGDDSIQEHNDTSIQPSHQSQADDIEMVDRWDRY